MTTPTRKKMIEGWGDRDPDIQDFMSPSQTNPWAQDDHSTTGYAASRWDNDTAGDSNWAGMGVDGADGSEAFARPSTS